METLETYFISPSLHGEHTRHYAFFRYTELSINGEIIRDTRVIIVNAFNTTFKSIQI